MLAAQIKGHRQGKLGVFPAWPSLSVEFIRAAAAASLPDVRTGFFGHQSSSPRSAQAFSAQAGLPKHPALRTHQFPVFSLPAVRQPSFGHSDHTVC